MSSTEEIFSLRLVIADFYMEKPVPGLDTCYSEFRGKEIKRVPIIRIFGSNSLGQKTCMHVHGVFPYFYIPYDQKDFESLNQAIYQIAINLDKAINISLSQGSSSAQHVFKVQLVKGIPFYGYHRSHHQFLKIYMFNPRFVRRAANLLQNGAILNKNFHPHESHVPYILQFMIDYNLYGMSFLHVPLDIVKFRTSGDAEENIPLENVRTAQVLDFNLTKKISCSSLEIDIGSNFILNRFQLITKTNATHSNPGIESIWHDERLRRQKLAQFADGENVNAIPPLEVPSTQERPGAQPTESELFYRTGLLSQLLARETSMIESTLLSNQTLSSNNISNTALNLSKPQKKTFNLTKILQNFVYPEECTQNDNIINASFIPNHLSNNNMFEQSVLIKSNEGIDQEEKKTLLDETIFMDDTIVDEELVLSLTETQYHKTQDQHHHVPLNATLREEDMELLSILQQLEENNDDKIDLDSTLAPVSQNQTNIDDLDKNTKATVESDFDEDADEDGNVLDFSIALENFDDLILKLTQSQEKSHTSNHKFDTDMPQVDGANDLLRTPTKSSKTTKEKSPPRTPTTPKNRRLTMSSPGRSPRTPKTSHKFAPLPLVSINRSAIKSTIVNNCNEVTPLKRNATDKNSLPTTSLRKNLALFDLRRKSISGDSNLQEHSTALREIRSRKHSKRSVNLDKTHITCSLTPRRSSEKFLKVYSIEKRVKPLNGNNKDLANKLIEDEVDTALNNNNQEKSKALTTKILKSNKTKSDVENQTHNNYLKKSKEQLVSKPSTSKTACKKNNTASEFTKQWELKKSSDIFQNNLKKNDVNDLENLEKNSCSSENDEEIVDSDNNSELSLENVTAAPNLKRLRRSFRASISDKQKNVAETAIIISSDLSSSKVTSKLCTNVEDKVIRNVKLNLKKCKVKLKRIEDTVLGGNKFVKNKTEDKIMEKQKVATTITSKEKQSENISSPKMLANCDENSTLNHMKTAPITSTHFVEADTFTKSSSIIPNKSKPTKNTLRTHKDYLEKDEQTLSKNLKNLQEALKLHLQSTEPIDRSELGSGSKTKHVPSSDVFSNSLSNESSGVEITETPPPQESNQFLKYSHIYNKSFELALQSPTLFSQSSSPLLLANEELKNAKISSGSTLMESECCITLSSASNHSFITPETKLVLTPLDLPPSREEVMKGCLKLQIPEYDFQQPFYSNPDDITKHKELGFTILQIPGNKLNDIEEFQSVLGTELKGLTIWRREQLIQLGGVEMLNKYRNTQSIREYFSSQKSVVITPQIKVPSRQETKLWLKAREVLTNKGEKLEELNVKNIEEDSPIKIRRQKVTMMLNAQINNDDSDDSLNCTSESLTLTPLTPATPDLKEDKAKDEIKRSFIPVTRGSGSTSLKRDMTFKKRNNCRILRRVSLNKQFKEAFEKEVRCNSKKLAQEATTIKESQILPGSQKSDTSVSNETALAELEKSSFMRHIKESDATMGGFADNSTLNSSFGFKVALENLQQAKSDVEFNYLTIITLEIFVATREDLLPNPELDEIRCLFYAIENSIPNDQIEVSQKLPGKACGYIMLHDHRDIVAKEGRIHGIDVDIEVTIVQTEVEALEALLNLCSRWDPDIYAGYEIEMSSWGFVIERAKYLCFNIAPLLSRVPTQKVRDFVDEDRESFTDLDVEMKLCGRILLDVWRLLRSEIALTSYTFENVMYHIMHKRCPWHSHRNLTEWFASPCSRWIVIEYYLERVKGTLALLDQLDIIGRTSEMAKLIGIQFYEVLSRGSQFRVESMMLRIAKPKNLVPLSPSVQQRAHMRAPEYLPLIMEPQSRFYADPMIVLDFQSLYPSMIMAYNYCFSTCLGRVEHLGQSTPFEFGASKLRVSPAMLRKLIDDDLITISPCGVVFVKSSVREGILPVMLTEILNTRQMVKQSMKLHKSNSALQRILHSRQLGLKLMANVTYGYTAANYSGRMPAVEVGDSVVSKGRETLERAIKMVEDNDKWNVKVVYGDTDSMFVLVPGRNRDEAFRIGEEIAEAVTKQNPHPVKLKLEKVYQPCILQTKKRYVGYMYETADQKEPVYEAKGIETVRRDGCPIVPKMLEKVLRILFESADVSQVKHYVCRQFTKILSGRANLQDLIFAKEFRGLNGYRPTACVPALELTRKWMQTDPRRVPRRGERVPFVITNGPPGVPLIRLVHHPHEILSDEGLKVNAIYYITKAIIPPLNRCLLLIGADVNEWFASLPRKILLTPAFSTFNEVASCLSSKSKKSTISQFFSTTNCIADCGRQTKHSICAECSKNSTRSVVILQTKISKIERSYLTTQHICQACCGRVGDLECGSLDCPVMFVLEVKRRELQQSMYFRKLVEEKF